MRLYVLTAALAAAALAGPAKKHPVEFKVSPGSNPSPGQLPPLFKSALRDVAPPSAAPPVIIYGDESVHDYRMSMPLKKSAVAADALVAEQEYTFRDSNNRKLASERDCIVGDMYFKDMYGNSTFDQLIYGYECVQNDGVHELRFYACYPYSKKIPVYDNFAMSGFLTIGPQFKCNQDSIELLGCVANGQIVPLNQIKKIQGSLFETVATKDGSYEAQMIGKTCINQTEFKDACRFEYNCLNETTPVMSKCTNTAVGSLLVNETVDYEQYEMSCQQKGNEMCFYRSRCKTDEGYTEIGNEYTYKGYTYECIKENGHASRKYIDKAAPIDSVENGNNEELGVVFENGVATKCFSNGKQYKDGDEFKDGDGVSYICKKATTGDLRIHAQNCLVNKSIEEIGRRPIKGIEYGPNACKQVFGTAFPVHKERIMEVCTFNEKHNDKYSTDTLGKIVEIPDTAYGVNYRQQYMCVDSSRGNYYFQPEGCVLDGKLIPPFHAEQAKKDLQYYECRIAKNGKLQLVKSVNYYCSYKGVRFQHYDEDGIEEDHLDEETGTVYGCDFGKLAKRYCNDKAGSFWPGSSHTAPGGDLRVCQERGEGFFVSSFPGCIIGNELRPFGMSYVIDNLQYRCELQQPKADMCEEQPRAVVCGCNYNNRLYELFTEFRGEAGKCMVCNDKGISPCTPKTRDCWSKYHTINCNLCEVCGNKTSTDPPPPRRTKATTLPSSVVPTTTESTTTPTEVPTTTTEPTTTTIEPTTTSTEVPTTTTEPTTTTIEPTTTSTEVPTTTTEPTTTTIEPTTTSTEVPTTTTEPTTTTIEPTTTSTEVPTTSTEPTTTTVAPTTTTLCYETTTHPDEDGTTTTRITTPPCGTPTSTVQPTTEPCYKLTTIPNEDGTTTTVATTTPCGTPPTDGTTPCYSSTTTTTPDGTTTTSVTTVPCVPTTPVTTTTAPTTTEAPTTTISPTTPCFDITTTKNYDGTTTTEVTTVPCGSTVTEPTTTTIEPTTTSTEVPTTTTEPTTTTIEPTTTSTEVPTTTTEPTTTTIEPTTTSTEVPTTTAEPTTTTIEPTTTSTEVPTTTTEPTTTTTEPPCTSTPATHETTTTTLSTTTTETSTTTITPPACTPPTCNCNRCRDKFDTCAALVQFCTDEKDDSCDFPNACLDKCHPADEMDTLKKFVRAFCKSTCGRC